MVCEFLRDDDGLEMRILKHFGKIMIEIKDSKLEDSEVSFILDKSDANFLICKLNELNNG